MMRMRVGLHHVLNDPVGLIYTPVIFSSICMYFTQYWLPTRVHQLLEYYYTCNDDLQPFFQIVKT